MPNTVKTIDEFLIRLIFSDKYLDGVKDGRIPIPPSVIEARQAISDMVGEIIGEDNDKATMEQLKKEFNNTPTYIDGELAINERDIYYMKLGHDQAKAEQRQRAKDRGLLL